MALTRLIPPGGTTGQVLSKVDGDAYNVEWETPGAGAGITELTGDATAGPGTGAQVVTVVALQGRAVQNIGPADLDVLTWNSGASRWEPQPGGGGGLGNYDVRKRAMVLCRGGR
jgi:hypothetical protein